MRVCEDPRAGRLDERAGARHTLVTDFCGVCIVGQRTFTFGVRADGSGAAVGRRASSKATALAQVAGRKNHDPQVPLSVKEALAEFAAGADGEGSAEALRFPLAMGPARLEAGAPEGLTASWRVRMHAVPKALLVQHTHTARFDCLIETETDSD